MRCAGAHSPISRSPAGFQQGAGVWDQVPPPAYLPPLPVGLRVVPSRGAGVGAGSVPLHTLGFQQSLPQKGS